MPSGTRQRRASGRRAAHKNSGRRTTLKISGRQTVRNARRKSGATVRSGRNKKVRGGAEESEDHFISPRGILLEHLLTDETKAKLRQKQVLYVVQANMDRPDGILKFGRGGFGKSDKNGAFNRLKSYVTSYGLNNPDPERQCTGVKIFFLAYGGPEFIRDLEEDLRRELDMEERVRRGRERVEASPSYVCARIRNIVGRKYRRISVLTPFRTDADSRRSPLMPPPLRRNRSLQRRAQPRRLYTP